MTTKTVASSGGSGPKQPTTTAGPAKPGIVATVREFYSDIVSEMKKVSWPTYDELKSLTQLVLWSLLVSGIVLGLYDLVFRNLIALILYFG
ncbi:MAG: preprotein translocase subunit SecE [Candidatus Hydrogenedentes bacterium]|nr:preprotein translocase subunit SecE [Candidatus Hydrogenedentota bacterium]